jgi:glycosyltransferase involved in cell wall biosynthesis
LGKVYIIEPTLILQAGHVKKCTEIFTVESLKLNKKTEVIVPFSAPDLFSRESSIKVTKMLPNAYQEILYKPELNPPSRYKLLVNVFFFYLTKKIKKKIIDFIIRLFWFIKSRKEMKRALDEMFSTNEMNAKDHLVFPNGDILCLLALLRMMKQIGNSNFPKISIRFINVMENAGVPKIYTSRILFIQLAKMQRKNFRISISAETENYRLHLAKYFSNTYITEYPYNPKPQGTRKRNQINIGVLGSARPDKGFEQLAHVIPLVAASRIGNRTQFIIQGSTFSWGQKYDEVLHLLQQFSKVRLLPGYISDFEMKSTIASCNYLLLPYDSSTYQFRGSAMLFDAADLEIPIIAPTGTGMGSVIRRFGIGATYSEISEIPDAIQYLSKIKQKEFNARFRIYNDYRDSGIRKFFE